MAKPNWFVLRLKQLSVKGTSLRNRLFWTLMAEPYSDKYSDLRDKHTLHNTKRKVHKIDEKRELRGRRRDFGRTRWRRS